VQRSRSTSRSGASRRIRHIELEYAAAAGISFLPESDLTVYDVTTDMPAMVEGLLQISLSLEDADDVADLLNHLHTQQLAATSH
jgi:hypothetical protein